MPDEPPRRLIDRLEDGLLGQRRRADARSRPAVEPAPAAPARRRSVFAPGDDASPFERAVGPGCLIALVITALLLIAFRRLTALSPVMLAIVAAAIFVAVLVVMLRMRPIRVDDNDPPGPPR